MLPSVKAVVSQPCLYRDATAATKFWSIRVFISPNSLQDPAGLRANQQSTDWQWTLCSATGHI